MKATWHKATAAQISAYAKTQPVYPLCAVIHYNGNRFPVEQCGVRGDESNPVYEVMCIEGMMFSEGVHSLLEWTQKDCLARVEMNTLEPSDDPNNIVGI